ncbi:multicopper oxidase domain-containing protein [Streptomyces sp. NPDC051657]|uniref:multicopper oxidase domain-containing protein n=1 Tax=unclassified Streptomyces TaxID=2593676 RepID=UPI00344323CF
MGGAAQLALPKTSGVDDLPVMVQDVTFDGADLDHGHGFLAGTGFLGERTMVNGTLDPYAEVGDEPVRLRLLIPVHDVRFRVLTVDGKRPEPALRGRKDTVAVPVGSTVRIALRFDGPSDPDTPYMYHCHLLSHEDEGTTGQFVVVEKGQRAGEPPEHAGH